MKKKIYVLDSNGYTTYYRTMSDLYKDYVSQDWIDEYEVSEEDYEKYHFEYDGQ